MPHEIWESRFVSSREPAWHRVGLHFAEPIPPSEAASLAGFREPQESELFLEDGTPVRDYKAITMDQEVFGIVSSSWRIFRLDDILPALDEIHEKYPLSAAGQIRGGRIVFFAFEQRDEILGEEYLRYLVVLHSYQPGLAWKVMYTPTRVVCHNTLVAAQGDREWEYRVWHNAPRGTEMAVAVMAKYRAIQQLVDAKLEAFARIGDFDSQLDVLFEHVYPYPPVPSQEEVERYGKEEVERRYQSAYERAKSLRSMARDSYDHFNWESPSLANTAYAALQAVTEVADWRGNLKSKDSPVLGPRSMEKVRAWKYLSSLLPSS